VVAEEIRNLSSSTSDSAKKISTRLKEIVERIQQATEMSTETGEAFREIEGEVKEFVNAFQEIASSTAELSTGSEEMLGAVNSLQDVAQEIQDGSEEMRSGSQDINTSLQALKDFSSSTVDSLGELVEKTSNVNYAQSNMTDLVIGNSDNAERLAREISRFRIGEAEEKEGRYSYSDLVKFSVGALLLQEWIVNVRQILSGNDGDRQLPKPDEGRLQRWIDDQARGLFGGEEEFEAFLRHYDSLREQTRRLAEARNTGTAEEVESVYGRIVETMKKAKSSLHSLRYSLSEAMESSADSGEELQEIDGSDEERE
jgi:uncharacterized phage infection (PIP) family protein YhgE